MLLVYSHKITPRVRYAFKHIITRILGVPVAFTSTVEDFIAHNSMKMSYAKKPLSNEIFIRSHELLFEQGLSDIEISVQDWDNTKCFFPTSEQSTLPFDIFAASFYLLSRYEEYLPHVKDDYGRFLATESLAYKNEFLRQPVIDIWAYKLKAVLQSKFEDFEFPEQKFSIQPIVDVPVAYYFRNKGLIRTVGGVFGDLFRFKLRRLYHRILVLTGIRQDPYDTFDWVIEQQKKSSFDFLVFFLLGSYSTFDKNISTTKKEFVSLIKSIADYSHVGLKASYLSLENLDTLKKEKKTLESIVNYDLKMSRNSFSKLNLPKSYRHLIELEIKQDFTMGYINQIGFRAGTCRPFFFYDLDYEIQTPLQIHSFHCLDAALLKYQSYLDKKENLQRLIEEVKQVDGTFTPVFHNYTFSESVLWKGYKDLFSLILNSAYEA